MDFKCEKLYFDSTEKRSYNLNVFAKELIDNNAKLLTVTANSCCNRCEMLNNEVLIEGVVNFCAIVKDENGIKKIERSERFNFNEICHGATPTSYMLASSDCHKVKGYIETGNLMLNCTVNISAILINPLEIQCFNELDGDEFRKKLSNVKLSKLDYKKNIRFSVTEEKELSPRVPEIEQILTVNASANVKEAHISAGQLIMGGEICLQTVYKSVDEYEPIVQVTDNFDFTQIIELKDAKDSLPIVKLCAEDIHTSILPNEQGEYRKITYNVGLCGYVYSLGIEEASVITDVYSVKNKLNCKNNNVEFIELCDKITSSVSKNIQVRLPENKTPIARINAVSFNPFSEKCIVDKTKMTVKCFGEVSCIYSASGTGETDGFNTMVEFDIVTDSMQFNDAEACFVNLSLCDMQAVLISGNEIEIRAGFNMEFIPQKLNECNVVNDIQVDEQNNYDEFGIVVYNVQKGEQLWDICKKFGVDIDEIKKLNNDLNDNPEENRKIFVFRKLAV